MMYLEKLKKQHKKLGEEYKRLGEEIEKLEKEGQVKLYDLVKFSDLDWYIVDEDDTTYTLFLKDKLSPEKCVKYFDERLLDEDKDVKFNSNNKNIWWSDSPIRMALNSEFLKELDTSKMELMETTVRIDDQSRTTEDYVRMIIKEEIKKLPNNIKNCSGEYGYWTMSPSDFSYWGNASEFVVTSTSELRNIDANNGYGVRPIIRVTKNGVNK